MVYFDGVVLFWVTDVNKHYVICSFFFVFAAPLTIFGFNLQLTVLLYLQFYFQHKTLCDPLSCNNGITTLIQE